MAVCDPGRGWHEMGPIRPPSEGRDNSLLLRVTRNCPWNRCTFCRTYKNRPYSVRSVAEIKADIETVKMLADGLRESAWRSGAAGMIDQQAVTDFIERHPALYDTDRNEPQTVRNRLQSLFNVAAWLSSGARTVFLQDANAPQIRTADLVEILNYLRALFPSIERITSYARSKTIARKPLTALKELKRAGLERLHIGFESGCNEVLAAIKKGTTVEEQIAAGCQTKAAGITLSEYQMPGVGGRRWSEKHALESARALSEINPDFIRLRSFVPRRGSPLFEQARAGDFTPLSEDETVAEIGLFVENLDCQSYLVSDQMCNLLWEIEGWLPEDKPRILKIIRDYLARPRHERLKLQLERRLSSYLGIGGRLEGELWRQVQEARRAAERNSPDAESRVAEILNIIKPSFV